MAKSKTSAGGSKSPPANSRTAKAAPTKAKPAARERGAARTAPASRAKEATKARPRTTTRGGQSSKARREAAPSRLRPISQRQSPRQIIAAVARDSGVASGTVERVARSLSQTLQRHLIRNGSGRVEIPYLGAALWRGREGARKARTMMSPLLGRNVQIPAKRAQAVTRLKVHTALREIVARV